MSRKEIESSSESQMCIYMDMINFWSLNEMTPTIIDITVASMFPGVFRFLVFIYLFIYYFFGELWPFRCVHEISFGVNVWREMKIFFYIHNVIIIFCSSFVNLSQYM